jgi:hypothetical protein
MLLILILIAAAAAGCNHKDANTESVDEPVSRQVKSFYPEDIHLANRIEMLQSGGERKTIDNKEVIDQWLGQVGEVQVMVDPNRPDHSGALFIVTVYENNNERFRLSPTSVNGSKIATSKELANLMRQLWNEDQSQ